MLGCLMNQLVLCCVLMGEWEMLPVLLFGEVMACSLSIALGKKKKNNNKKKKKIPIWKIFHYL